MFRNLCPGTVGLGGPVPEVMALAREVGFEGVDPNLGHDIGEQKELYAELGLQIGSFGLPVNFRTDEETYEKGMASLSAVARKARELGCLRCATWLSPASDELTYEENFALHVRRLKPVAEVLAGQGIRFGLEFVGPATSRRNKKYEFVHTLGQVLALRDAIGVDTVGILLDAWHWYTSRSSVAELTALTNEDIVLVHANDAPAGIPIDEQMDGVRELPGETGVIDMTGFIGALEAIGYDGPVSPEPFCKRLNELDRRARAETVAGAMRRILP